MKRTAALAFALVMLLSFVGCSFISAPNERVSDAPTLMLNGVKLDVYTSHYQVGEKYAIIPADAFLMSIGAEYKESTLNRYGRQCYSLMGIAYVIDEDEQMFLTEDQYNAYWKEMKEKGSTELPHSLFSMDRNGRNDPGRSDQNSYISWSKLFVDHVTLMNALRESGLDITIESDYKTQTINVTMPNA